MTFGAVGKEGTRVHDIKDIEAILDVFQAHGHKEVSYKASKGGSGLSIIDVRSTPLAATVVERVKSISERSIGRREEY